MEGAYAMREIVNAILHQGRTGCQWPYFPHDLPPKSATYFARVSPPLPGPAPAPCTTMASVTYHHPRQNHGWVTSTEAAVSALHRHRHALEQSEESFAT
jgi:transposase